MKITGAAPRDKWGTFIVFVDVTHKFPRVRKTRVWIVGPRRGCTELGYVRWFGPWLCYCFYPCPNTLYEQRCLRDIANFCEDMTTRHVLALREKAAA